MRGSRPNHNLSFEQALSDWQLWSTPQPLTEAPRLVRTMPGGLTNHSALIQSGELKMVLRLNAINSYDLGLDRNMERNTLLNAARAELAPKLIHSDLANQYLVTEFIPGNHWENTGLVEDLEQVARLLHQVHHLSAEGTILKIHARANHYWQSLEQLLPTLTVAHSEHSSDASLLTQLLDSKERLSAFFSSSAIKSLRPKSHLWCLCHNDPCATNILDHQQRLYLIDWEYAAVGDPFFDLAVFADSEQLDQPATLTLLDAYQPRDNLSLEQKHTRLKLAQTDFYYLDLLWHGVQVRNYEVELLQDKLDHLLALIADFQ